MRSTKSIVQMVQSSKTYLLNFLKTMSKSGDVKIRRFVDIHNDSSFGKYAIVQPWVVSEKVTVPAYIPQPSYSQSMVPKNGPVMPEIKDEYQIECMRHSCKLASRILRQAGALIEVLQPIFSTNKYMI